MSRTKLQLPEKFSFHTSIPVRITDINYGGHVGNDSILSIIHEIRVHFLQHLGFSEFEFGGVGLIMTSVTIDFKKELHYGEVIQAETVFSNISSISFDIIYHLFVFANEQEKRSVALAKTTMTCFDYKKKKVVAIPEAARMVMMQ
jgi:YbgC/YbaW family acyl-CoA thioester hydrolase